MTPTHHPSARFKKLTEAIERAAPDAGFWMKGKPLDFSLEDVLGAIYTVNNSIVIDTSGQFWIDQENGEGGHKWFFGKPLSEQSDETMEFLLGLLTSN